MSAVFDLAWDILKAKTEKRCLQCGGIIPEKGGGPYLEPNKPRIPSISEGLNQILSASSLCDCKYPDDPDSYEPNDPEQGDPDREPMLNTWHPEDEQVERL